MLLMNGTDNLVLRFSGKSSSSNAATLHAATCSVVKGGSNPRRGIVVTTENVAFEVEDLKERGFKVKRCACVGPASLSVKATGRRRRGVNYRAA